MKRIIIAIAIVFMMVSTVQAADVIISITIPSAYVPRLQAAVENGVNCQKRVVTPTETEVPILNEFGEPTGETTTVINDVTTWETLAPKACLIRNIKNELIQIVRTYERQLAEKAAQAEYSIKYHEWSDNYQELEVIE